MTRADFEKKKKKVPDGPGVYFFLGPRKEILYIGKAASLQSRVRSYFSPDLPQTRSPLVVQMVEKARSLNWRETDSVLEALLLEASLIKTYKPKGNTDEKDDKSFTYVVITKEAFPRVLLVRGKELQAENAALKIKKIFGPFPHGMQLKEALKIIRKIFPYRDNKCIPCEKQLHMKVGLLYKDRTFIKCRPCFNRQLGLCPGVCTGEISKENYGRTVRHLYLFFDGKKKALLRELARDMKRAAKEEAFELAKEYRRQIFALQHIQDVSLIKDEYRAPEGVGRSHRIEAYDVAHLQGSAAVGVMVVVEAGAAKKSDYRAFHIRSSKAGDDPGALREILSRRLAHDEWPYPRLIVVDGSKAQINAAEKILAQAGTAIPVVGVVKNERHQPRGVLGDRGIIRDYERDILLANAEAHRFAIGRHRRRLRSRTRLY